MNWEFVLDDLIVMGHLLLSLLLVLPVALNRQRNTEIMGMRTFPLVAMGACGNLETLQQERLNGAHYDGKS